MSFKLMLSTFLLVFLAELGDKTQLATFCLSADCNSSRFSVFLGSAAALTCSSFIAVFLGDLISRFLPPDYIKIGSGAFFIIAGVWILFSSLQNICRIG